MASLGDKYTVKPTLLKHALKCFLPLKHGGWQPATSLQWSKHISSIQEFPYSGKVWRGECLVNSSVWRKKVWQMNRSAKWLLIVTTTLDGFSLANCRQFAKFAKLSAIWYMLDVISFQSNMHSLQYLWLVTVPISTPYIFSTWKLCSHSYSQVIQNTMIRSYKYTYSVQLQICTCTQFILLHFRYPRTQLAINHKWIIPTYIMGATYDLSVNPLWYVHADLHTSLLRFVRITIPVPYYYVTRDLQGRLGLMKQGGIIFTVT